MDIHAVTHRLQTLFVEVLTEKNRTRYHEGLWRSYGHVATPGGARRRVQFVADLCDLARFSPEGKVILDAGCGYGVIAIILAMMGANKVVGIDISEERLNTFAQIIQDYGFDKQLADGNNASNPLRRRHTQEIWERFENGPPGTVHGHVLEVPYIEMHR